MLGKLCQRDNTHKTFAVTVYSNSIQHDRAGSQGEGASALEAVRPGEIIKPQRTRRAQRNLFEGGLCDRCKPGTAA